MVPLSSPPLFPYPMPAKALPPPAPASGKRKRVASEKAMTNGDPLLTSKRPKATHNMTASVPQSTQPTTSQPSTQPKASQASRPNQSTSKRASVENVEDDEDDIPVPKKAAPKNKNRILESDDESDDNDIVEIDAPKSRAGSPDSVVEIEDPDEETPDKELERLSQEWTSNIYGFFSPTVKIAEINGRRAHEFECSAEHCKGHGVNARIVRRFLDKGDAKSTSNLKRHAIRCWGETLVEQAMKAANVESIREGLKDAKLVDGSITAVFKRNGKGKITYSHRQHTASQTRAEIVRWVSESMRPFNIVEDRGFKCLMLTGRHNYRLPSRVTVARDVKRVFKKARKRIAKMLQCQMTYLYFPGQDYDGALSFGTDAWTSPNSKAYVAVTVHYETDGVPQCLLLDIAEVARSHTGLNLAIAFAKILEDFGIEDKRSQKLTFSQQILSLTCDNASSNDALISQLPTLLDAFPGAANRTRCFTHILNLVAKVILRQFDTPKGKADDAIDDAADALAGLENEIDRDLEEELELAGDIELEEQEMERDTASDEDEDDDETGMVDYRKEMTPDEIAELDATLRKIAYAVKNSTTILLPEWNAIIKRLGIASKAAKQKPLGQRVMPRDVTTRWNSTFDMLVFALEYQQVINEITASRDFKMRKYELQSDEWEIAEQLCSVLKIFKDATFDKTSSRHTTNIFDDLPECAPLTATAAIGDELKNYLNSKIEDAPDPLKWWHQHRATSVDVERVFSKGRLVLSHIRNRLSVDSTRALMCLGAWSKLGFVHDSDINEAANLPEVAKEDEADNDWDFDTY
ncbi:hypothetical protein D9613_009691 [Agrocybe pediades]|uniref:HAT C-terminal dimerisation domain-containing protein n=1 Tax=Agrocybe pediades TaxID=84607 RepID=A0A8H4QYZ5_9AGAR|nr:hypothetical protein D9613_009691 [Agrocybe pediades]